MSHEFTEGEWFSRGRYFSDDKVLRTWAPNYFDANPAINLSVVILLDSPRHISVGIVIKYGMDFKLIKKGEPEEVVSYFRGAFRPLLKPLAIHRMETFVRDETKNGYLMIAHRYS
jgi:hypothetical protein